MALTPQELAAVAELRRINGNSHLSDPNGLGDDGHRVNFVPGLHAMADVTDAVAREADAAVAAALSAAAQAASLSGTSTTSVAIGAGSNTLTTQAGKAFGAGTFVLLTSDANPTTHYILGQVTAYSGASLTIAAASFAGSGSRADWTIRVAGGPGAAGADGKQVELQKSATHIQWRLAGGSWANLIAIADLKGADGREIEMQVSATHVQWRYVGASSWTDLIALSALKGADGREVQMQGGATHIQWRYAGVEAWTDIVALSDLKGEPGPRGAQIINGARDPAPGDGSNDDYWMQSADGVTGEQGDFWFKSAGAWTKLFSMKGPAGSGSGDVVGPNGSVVDAELALFSGTTGKTLKGSGKTIATLTADLSAAMDAAESAKFVTPKALWDTLVPLAISVSGGVATPDFGARQNFTLALTGNTTLANPPGAKIGQSGTIQLTRSALQTLSYGAAWNPVGEIELPAASGAGAKIIYEVVSTSPLRVDFSVSYAGSGGAGGTVTSVGLSLPAGFTVTGSPVTASGTLTGAWAAGYQAYTAAEADKVAGIAIGADVTATAIGAATAKETPVNEDTIPLTDSAASGALKKVTWTVIKAALKTYFDGLYVVIQAMASEVRAGTVENRYVSPSSLWAALAPVELTDAATIAINLAGGINFRVEITDNRTLGNPTNVKAGQQGTINVTRSAAQTLAFGSNWRPYGNTTLPATGKGFKIAYEVIASTVIHYSIIPEA
ncbi:hypothetical protein FHS82_001081 [Pseudochelatococcus lubricantis]|uniref:Minor tail protein n=1 Tax=Pseudochelatococcus lubricantis TaxID=1538102 RepID=A0ABX0UZE2_9HYPH|nr:hypothetical protein [Pseudochelatococcus lubricantis]NIJ57255.1 hypothetical protein [Pseudochelatococcus lubricantis]